jgi:hypothetical protein
MDRECAGGGSGTLYFPALRFRVRVEAACLARHRLRLPSFLLQLCDLCLESEDSRREVRCLICNAARRLAPVPSRKVP